MLFGWCMANDLQETHSVIIPLDQWRVKRVQRLEKESLKKSLSVLSFPDLMQLTQDLVKSMEQGPYDLEAIKKSMAVLQEIRERIHQGGPEMSTDLARMIDELQTRQSLLH